jgi:hypothetical protein
MREAILAPSSFPDCKAASRGSPCLRWLWTATSDRALRNLSFCASLLHTEANPLCTRFADIETICRRLLWICKVLEWLHNGYSPWLVKCRAKRSRAHLSSVIYRPSLTAFIVRISRANTEVAYVIEVTAENEFKELNYVFRLLEVTHVFVNGTYRCFDIAIGDWAIVISAIVITYYLYHRSIFEIFLSEFCREHVA